MSWKCVHFYGLYIFGRYAKCIRFKNLQTVSLKDTHMCCMYRDTLQRENMLKNSHVESKYNHSQPSTELDQDGHFVLSIVTKMRLTDLTFITKVYMLRCHLNKVHTLITPLIDSCVFEVYFGIWAHGFDRRLKWLLNYFILNTYHCGELKLEIQVGEYRWVYVLQRTYHGASASICMIHHGIAGVMFSLDTSPPLASACMSLCCTHMLFSASKDALKCTQYVWVSKGTHYCFTKKKKEKWR